MVDIKNNLIIDPENGVNDLRNSIKLLKKIKGAICEDNIERSTYIEVANEYRKKGSGSPAKDGRIPPRMSI